MKDQLINELRQGLKEKIDPKALEVSKHFYKEGEEAKVYGIRMAEVHKMGKLFYQQIKEMPKEDIYEIAEKLWESDYLEETVIACICTELLHKKYEPTDFKLFEHWVKDYVADWVSCDTLCSQTLGSFIIMYPQYLKELKKWAKSSNRWVKRAAAVTLILPARKGLFLNDVFEIANILLLDKDDMVQKGYGWMLKVSSQTYQKEVYEFVIANKAVMPRTALRYAIEKMPPDLRKEAMKK